MVYRDRREILTTGKNAGQGRIRGRARGGSVTFTVSIGTGDVTTGTLLTATVGGLVGGEVVTYQWTQNGTNISGATSSTYTPTIGTGGIIDQGLIRCEIVVDGTRPATSPARRVIHAAAVNTVAPVVSGSLTLGATLTTTNGTWTGAVGGSFTYQWQRGGVDIAGATASTYTIVAADSAASVRCVVTYTNSGGAVSANSNAVTVQTFAAPDITGVPTISGTTSVGQTLTATPASVSGNPTPSRTWQWERAGTPISGATSATYTLVSADVGATLTVVQTETNALGADSAESAATATISDVLQITSVNMQAQGTDGLVPVGLVADNGTYSWVLVTADPAVNPPSRAQVIAGQNHLGAAAPASGSLVWAGVEVDLTGITVAKANYYLVLADGDSIVFDGPIEIDGTAPTLSSPTGTQTGQTTANGSVTSNDATGVIYAGVWPTASTPTAAQIVAGTGAVYHTTDNTPTAGANNFSATGLTASTAYKWHFVQDDDRANRSGISTSAEFTTASAAVGMTVVRNAGMTNLDTSITMSAVDFGAGQADLEAIVMVVGAWNTAPASGTWDCTVGGNAATQLGVIGVDRACTAIVFRAPIPAGGSLNVVMTRNSGASNVVVCRGICLRVTGRTGFDSVSPSVVFVGNNVTDVSQTVAAGSAIFAAWGARNSLGASTSVTWAGVTEFHNSNPTNPQISLATVTDLSAGTRTITATTAGEAGAPGRSAISMEFSP